MKILNGTIDGRARESRHTGDEGNTSSPQLFGIDGSDKVLLSLIQVGEQRSVFLLQFFLFAHTVSITWGASFVTIIVLQALKGGHRLLYRLLSWNEWQGVFLRIVSVLRC